MSYSVEIKNLDLRFGNLKVLENLNLGINNGEFLVLLGSSGCGKSTLLNSIAGLLEISDGQIFINGQNVTWAEPSERGIGMVFQSYALYPQMTVEGNLSFGLKNAKLPRDEIKSRVARAAEILQIEPLLKRKPAELSGGQRQRVAIGRALVRDVEVFLFDEPLSNLDAKLRADLRVEIKQLHQKLNNTMIYVTHDQTEAMTLADDIVVLDEGIVSQKGSPMELYSNPSNLFVGGFIGSPKMNFVDSKILSATNDSTEIDIFGTSKITIPKTSSNSSNGDSVTLGIRPEHLLVNQDGDASWESKVFVVEKLGSGTFLYLEKDGEPLVVETEGDSNIKVGDTVKVGFTASRCQLFDSSNQAFK